MDVLAALKNGTATIVDVRSREEFQSGHIAGSINIPLQEVPTKVEEFKNMPKPLVLCCLSGGRSAQATGYLQQQGVEEVYNGGGWMEVNALV
jgi:rhodanese-related sulfurtransferase